MKTNEIDVIFEIVQLHAGTGNSTWIFEAAKANPKCNIMCVSNCLARNRKQQFEEWFYNEHKRAPKQDETPHFFGIGGVVHYSKYGLTAPLILDNSCFDMRFIKEYRNIASKHTFEVAEEGFRKRLSKYKSMVSDIKALISHTWFIPCKKMIIGKINKIENKYKTK